MDSSCHSNKLANASFDGFNHSVCQASNNGNALNFSLNSIETASSLNAFNCSLGTSMPLSLNNSTASNSITQNDIYGATTLGGGNNTATAANTTVANVVASNNDGADQLIFPENSSISIISGTSSTSVSGATATATAFILPDAVPVSLPSNGRFDSPTTLFGSMSNGTSGSSFFVISPFIDNTRP